MGFFNIQPIGQYSILPNLILKSSSTGLIPFDQSIIYISIYIAVPTCMFFCFPVLNVNNHTILNVPFLDYTLAPACDYAMTRQVVNWS